MLRLLLATNNPGKVEEFKDLLKGSNLELVTPAYIGLDLKVEESGSTYTENAMLKAKSFSLISGLWTLADDSGLEVDALGGLPGLHSARYIGREGATDYDRRNWLLHNLQGKPKPWNAQFRCAIALIGPSGSVHTAEGICSGEIISSERGNNGFGYDPIFKTTALGKTMAELNMQEKNQISHRAHAIKGILHVIREFISIEAKIRNDGGEI